MRTGSLIVILVILVIVIGVIWGASTNWWHNPGYGSLNNPATSTTTSGTGTTTAAFDESISDGLVTLYYASPLFGLATTPQQILVKSYIPSCSDNFNYCLYYINPAYHGTNFESAGIRVEKRTDLGSESICLNTPPSGYSSSTLPVDTHTSGTYSTSAFTNIGDAGAGHFASGSLYRLFIRGTTTCYEFETRIGETNFANYTTGSITEFTQTDAMNVLSDLNTILRNITISSGEKIVFPTL